ncbi:serine hydrolase domain-containing protein [Actinomadura alba]|uniref:Beta-lactamase family protein n=1 Tax=Actinomadura alba TaxID=406431 RepID=A0ABR7LR87_9ACTN|nr:serine hydrolase domain-containing protein [Actinomadura alba]MBC6467363.1 beta-lactamase family protein [Actinomadura alba]
MSLNRGRWQRLLDEAAAAGDVPGATLAIYHGGESLALATGVLHLETGVETTPGSVFQIGSVTKAYTAALVMRLADRGVLDIDIPLITYVPEFRVADPVVSQRLTLRHLLTHTGGIDGDHFLDTGRGDDALERYVESCVTLEQAQPPDTIMSYCNSGFVIIGRVVEKVTGGTFEDAIRTELLDPLGVTRTVAFPDDVLRFRAAYGHVPGTDGKPVPAPRWSYLRSIGPAGGLSATAEDVLAFGRMLLDDGVSPLTGERVLPADAVRLMRTAQIAVPDTRLADHWGLGLMLMDWDGGRVAGHDGGNVGQGCLMRFAPGHDTAVVITFNGGDSSLLGARLFGEIFSELAGITMPAQAVAVSGAPLPAGADDWTGTYDSVNVTMLVEPGDDRELALTLMPRGIIADNLGGTNFKGPLLPTLDENIYAAGHLGSGEAQAVVFLQLGDGTRYIHCNGRALRRVKA